MNKSGSMELKSYTLGELNSHMEQLLDKNLTLPLSPLRLTSYLANPRARMNDPVLFEMYDGKKLIAYRTLLPDYWQDSAGETRRFAWLSGNYVHPDYRRKGLSTSLLTLAEEHWESSLMYTNYAPESKAVYDHTGKFRIIARREGKRFYLRSSSRELLGNRLGAKNLLQMGDNLVNKLREGRLQKFKVPEDEDYILELIDFHDYPGDEKQQSLFKTLVDPQQKQSLFGRDQEVFTWILKNPWVTEQKVGPLDYHFTFGAEKFDNLIWRIAHKSNEAAAAGFLWLVIINKQLSVPYAFADHPHIYSLMAKTMLHTMVKHDCAHMTTRHPDLLPELNSLRHWFLGRRDMPQLVFAHEKIASAIPPELRLHDGDGDVVFTG